MTSILRLSTPLSSWQDCAFEPQEKALTRCLDAWGLDLPQGTDHITKLWERYANFVEVARKKGMTEAEIGWQISFIDRTYPFWVARKKEVYLKKRDEPELSRTIEYDPDTKQVYTHFKSKVTSWLKGPPLGKGMFGKITESVVVQTGRSLANKTIKKATVVPQESARRLLLSEGNNLQLFLGSQNIVQVERVSNRGLLLELMEQGTLEELLKKWQNSLTSPERNFIALDALSGLKAIHSKGRVHKDIKLENMLVDIDGIVKITDFGLACPVGMRTPPLRGTPHKFSPQIYKSWTGDKPHPSSFEDDVWAMGVALFELEHSQTVPSFFDAQDRLAMALLHRDKLTAEMRSKYPNIRSIRSKDAQDLEKKDPQFQTKNQELIQKQEEVSSIYNEYYKAVENFENNWQPPENSLASVIKEMLLLEPGLRMSADVAHNEVEILVAGF